MGILAGCGNSPREHDASNTKVEADEPTRPRRQQAPHALPQRIVSQTLLSDEILWDLGPQVRAHVIAVSKLADDPRYSSVVGRRSSDAGP